MGRRAVPKMAAKIGANTAAVVEAILTGLKVEQQATGLAWRC